MSKYKTFLKTILLTICSLPAFATYLTLPQNLISLDSPAGQNLFLQSRAKADAWPLLSQFVSQDNLYFCGVASSVMVLNALNLPGPNDPTLPNYSIFTQQNFFTSTVNQAVPLSSVMNNGLTLDQLAKILRTFPLQVQATHMADTSCAQFKKQAIQAVNSGKQYLIVNFSRESLGELGSGHFSPVAAYNAKSDRFLVLDVARFKYPPFWVTTADLCKAMNTVDSTSQLTRGFLLISAASAANS